MESSVNLSVISSDSSELDFTWYELVRIELLRKVVDRRANILDIGCRQGDVLFDLSYIITKGTGIDISENDLTIAKRIMEERRISNLEFIKADAACLPFEENSFNTILCLGDILSYSNLFGKDELVLNEIHRVLEAGGLTVHQCMNWEWEYQSSPQWVYFTRNGEGIFFFHRVERTPSGLETITRYKVVGDSILQNWLLLQDWPEHIQSYTASLDVIEEEKLSDEWLRFEDITRHQHYTVESLIRKYESVGFRAIKVIPYGFTHDVINEAQLLLEMTRLTQKLAKAEAEILCRMNLGAGPWLFLSATK